MENTTIKYDFKEYVKSQFEKLQSTLNGSVGSELNLLRKNAFDKFFLSGLPTLKSENWKYTNLAFLNKLSFTDSYSNVDLSKLETSKLFYNSLKSHKIYLINGKLDENLSSNFNSVNGLKIEYFENISINGVGDYANYYGKLTSMSEHPFANINTALADNLLVVNISPGVIIEDILQIININISNEGALLTNPRILVISGKSSSAKIVENNYTLGDFPVVRNLVKEFYLEENAHLNYYKIQDDSNNSHLFDFTHAEQKRDSHLDEAAISINGKFVRNDLRSTLDGENIESHYYGIFIVGANDFVDNHTFVDHAKPNSYSNENYRGVAFDKGTGVFNVKIMVRRDAQKTNAYQSNKNVLLSDSATINTKPELEIYADDVKCSHGATSGSIDKTSMFYLRQRGIEKKVAERLLLFAFVNEVVNEIKIEQLRELIDLRIEEKLLNI